MKKLIVIIFILLWCGGGVAQETSQDLVAKVVELRSLEGDISARNFIEQQLSVQDNKEYIPTLLSMWGSLTSNIWQTNKADSITSDYKEYIERFVLPEISNESFVNSEDIFNWLYPIISDYATMLFYQGMYMECSKYLSLILSRFDEFPETKSTLGYVRTLKDYSFVLMNNLHKYMEARTYYEILLESIRLQQGEESAEYALAMYNFSVCLQALNQRADALSYNEKALKIYNKLENQDSILLQKMQEGIRINKMLSTGIPDGHTTQDSSTSDLSLADCISLVVSGRGHEALPSLLKIKGEKTKEVPIDTLYLAAVEQNICVSYLSTGDAYNALVEYESFDTKYSITSLPNQYAAPFYTIKGQIHVQLKQYESAKSFFLASLRLHAELKDFGIEYIKDLANVSQIHINQSDYLAAKWYIDEAIDLFESDVNENIYDSSIGAMLLNNKGLIYSELKETDVAEMIFKSVMENCDNPSCQEAYRLASNNLAAMYIKQSRWKDAETILLDLQGDNDEQNYIFAQNLALCNYFSGNEKLAIHTLEWFNGLSKDNVLRVFTCFSDVERENYWKQISQESIMANNLLGYHFNNPKFQTIAYNNTLFCRNLSIKSQNIIDEYASSVSEKSEINLFDEHNSLKAALTYKSTDSSERSKLFNRLTAVEREILSSIPNLKEQLWNIGGNCTQVGLSLDDDEIALEYTYVPIMQRYDDVTGYYGAFVMRKGWTAPKMILLEEVDIIDDIVYNSEPDEMFINQLYGKSTMSSLYNMLWNKLEPFLHNTKTVYYTPTGFLSNINYEQLQDNHGHTLRDKYNLVRVSSTANIPNYKKNKQTFNSATLFGNIPYDESIADMAAESSRYSTYSGEDIGGSLALRSADDRGRWGALPYTKLEIDSISLTLTGNDIATTSFEGAKGNEESFKALSGKSPDIIHLATHGFVIDTQKKAEGNKFVEGTFAISPREGYLTWTGLMLAGANNAWTGNFNLDNVEDGVLTADEISRLDLSNTKLVVLSACETARGKIDPVEGVIGLQRAFKKAGVQTIVMSLWKVPDESTAILMTEFYRNLMNGVEIHQALKNAENRVKELYPDPYYWAGFIILD